MIHVFIIKLSISIYLIWLGLKNIHLVASYLSRNLPTGSKVQQLMLLHHFLNN